MSAHEQELIGILTDIKEQLRITEDNNGARHLNLLSVIETFRSSSMVATKSDLQQIENKIDKIMATEQQVIDALNKIDAATTKIATNVAAEATVAQTISDEIDAIQKALAAALASGTGVSQALVDQASALSDKAQASSDSLDALVPVLQAIATKGVLNPVPVPVPVPTPTPTP